MKPYYEQDKVSIYCGDALSVLRTLPDESVQCCVTSPPYWGLRDYGMDGQIGVEQMPEDYTRNLVSIFTEVRRVLRADGTLWLNLGDSYANDEKWGGNTGGKHVSALHGNRGVGRNKTQTGLKPKDLVGIPWRVAFALQADGWYLRSDIIWNKPNPMPESVSDRPTKAHEYLFLLSKSERYQYDAEAIAEACVSDHGSGNGFKRDERLSYMDADGPRGNDKPWKPNGKHAMSEPQAPGRRMVENVARARAAGAEHDSPFGGTRNKRSVWTINTQPYPDAHFAVMPEALIAPCILAGARKGDTIIDPFSGSGTVGAVAERNGNPYIGIELNPDYCQMAVRRFLQVPMDLQERALSE